MSIDDTKPYEPSAIKNAAELLTRGASLISEACPTCQGVQVKFKDVVTCINCGNKQKVFEDASSVSSKQQSVIEDSKRIPLKFIEEKVTSKVVKLINILDDNDEDLIDQKKKADLLELYLRIIERTRHLRNKFDF